MRPLVLHVLLHIGFNNDALLGRAFNALLGREFILSSPQGKILFKLMTLSTMKKQIFFLSEIFQNN